MSKERNDSPKGGEREIKIDRPHVPNLGDSGQIRNNDHFDKGNKNSNQGSGNDGYIGKPTIGQLPPTDEKK